jgi:hypothetical protein
MNFKRLVILGLALYVFLLVGCDSEPLSNKTAQTNVNEDLTSLGLTKTSPYLYQKPGAKVGFSHNYKGFSEVGEIENIDLVFTDGYSSGQLQIKLESDTALSLEPSMMDYIFSLEGYSSNKINLSIQTHNEGKHFLNIFARITDENGYSSGRVFAIAFYAGENAKRKIGPRDLEAESVIRLPSIVTSEPADSP